MLNKNGPAGQIECNAPTEHVAHTIDEHVELEVWVTEHDGWFKPTWHRYGEQAGQYQTTSRLYKNTLAAMRGAYWQAEAIR